MIYVWLIPLTLLLVVPVTLMFRQASKSGAPTGRLNESSSEDLHT